MKINQNYFFLLAFIGLASCNSLKDIATIGIPVTFENIFSVAVTEDLNYSYMDTVRFDATTNGDVAEHLGKDNINNYQITDIQYLISAFKSERDTVWLENGALTFYNDDSTEVVTWELENLNLRKLSTSKKVQKLAFTAEEFQQLGNILFEENSINMKYTAKLDTVATYKCKVTFDMSIKVGI